MKTPLLRTAFCLGLAPWAAASQAAAAPPASPSTPAVVFHPIELGGAAVALVPGSSSQGQKGMLGIYLADDDERAVVAALVPGGPAESAGFQPGDRIVAVDGAPVASLQDVRQRLASHHAGDRMQVRIERDGWAKDFELVLGAAPDAPAGSGDDRADAAPRLEDALKGAIGKQVIEQRVAEKRAAEKQAEKSKSVAGKVRVQEAPAPRTLAPQDDGKGGSTELRDRVLVLKKQSAGKGADAEDSGSKSCCEGDCCPGCCESGSKSVSGFGHVAPEGAWTIDLDDLTDELPAIVGEGSNSIVVVPRVPNDLDVRVQGEPLKLRSGVLRRMGAEGSPSKQVEVYRVDGEDSPVRVEVQVEKEGDASGASRMRVFHDGEWQELPGSSVFRVEGGEGPHDVRVFRGELAPRAGRDAGDDQPGARRADLGELREELENLREELHELRQALRRVQANGGTR